MPIVQLTAADGHVLDAYRVEPEGVPRGALIVVQEIFGVNAHIRAVASRFAAAGYVTIAPAIFDRVERGIELGYDEPGFTRGRALVQQLSLEGLLADIEASRLALANVGSPSLVGYCYGGSVAWVAAAKLSGLGCAISYYGSRIQNYEELTPLVPVMMHVGRSDASFPLERVHGVAAKHPNTVTVHEYDAGHGFNCDHRRDFNPDAAAVALQRSLALLSQS